MVARVTRGGHAPPLPPRPPVASDVSGRGPGGQRSHAFQSEMMGERSWAGRDGVEKL